MAHLSHSDTNAPPRGLSALPSLRGRPIAFIARYARQHPAGHATVLLSVLIAVACSVSTQYGLKMRSLISGCFASSLTSAEPACL